MKLTTLLTSALYLVPVVLAQQYNITYNAFYNDGDSSLSFTACSRLIPTDPVLASFHDFPYIGGTSAITSENTTACGTCWQLDYNGNSIYITAVDTAEAGFFNLTHYAFEKLTDGQTGDYVSAIATEVDSSHCGFCPGVYHSSSEYEQVF
ncbi:predicted protein [Postia placenta Mad-698-R]|uniref:Cerato-platanin n=1 Tax=Postia placenta MAD-698-R-SB12 TaxID=670580 RepID=A0A1X6MQY6_9APHY|nr:hypothetical protein POSPLADRAFT_1059885 [Postia placenta MAD-698-R-SB12]EED79834.1 predicted protein [Postia placenta Mad-698-R]OSX58788.1 hypothetical protein POSPLADRAFT_1059885 [Postia placenta MAD-698-R-SB12]